MGAARIIVQIPGSRSLKDRRRVIKSFKDRLKSRLGISAAEIGDPEKLQRATLGVAVVSGDSAVCHELLSSVRQMAESLNDALLADYRAEVFSFGREGAGIDVDDDWGPL